MAFTEDLSIFLADFGQACMLAGASVQAIVDLQVLADDETGNITQQMVARVPTSAVPAAAVGQAFVASGTAYVVRRVLREPPDGVFTLLVIARD